MDGSDYSSFDRGIGERVVGKEMAGVERASSRRPHVLMITVDFPGHFAPFVQLLYHLSRRGNVVVTLMASKNRIADLSGLQARGGDFEGVDLRAVNVFGEVPTFKCDPCRPPRPHADFHSEIELESFKQELLTPSGQASWALETAFQPFKEKLIEGRDDIGAPTCIIADMFLWWTKDIADELGIPWYSFYTTASWHVVCALEAPRLLYENLYPTSARKNESVPIPGLKLGRVGDICNWMFIFPEFYARISDRTLKAAGILVNTSEEVDAAAGGLDALRALVECRPNSQKGEVTRVLAIGPVLNFPGYGVDYNSTHSSKESLRWLDTQSSQSVLYIAFGTLSAKSPISEELIVELALGLEASGVPFLWVLKVEGDVSIDSVLPPGYESRMKDRGFIERGWAPQPKILLHPATGGFLSHCGWNSTMESLCAGVPIITWPLFADQPFNARFIADVLKVGIALSDGLDTSGIDKEAVAKVVKTLMLEKKGMEIRRNVVEVKRTLQRSVSKGGSSYRNLNSFLDEILTS